MERKKVEKFKKNKKLNWEDEKGENDENQDMNCNKWVQKVLNAYTM